MPIPVTQNNYDKLVMKFGDVAKVVAEESMNDAADDIRSNTEPSDGVVNRGISSDGSWQRKGYSSLNGVVTVISIDNGKHFRWSL